LGKNERQIEIIVNPRSVKSYGLTAKDVLVSLQAGNILIPAGSLSGMSGSFNLKVPGLFENIDDLLKLPIKSNNKSVITLGEIADIKDTFKEIEGFARNNGKKAIVLEVSKRTGENIIETIKSIKNEVKFYSDEFSNELKIDFFQDESKAINSMISDLENNVILAILIVSLIIIYSMGKKSAILVGISIPGSFLISMIFLSFLGVTINIVVLFSLILSVGILIDGTIIVVEYANRRTAEGISKKEVFIISAQKMSTPVIASTLTTLSAFFPLIF
jgi:Cation/multidrug efflux pump